MSQTLVIGVSEENFFQSKESKIENNKKMQQIRIQSFRKIDSTAYNLRRDHPPAWELKIKKTDIIVAITARNYSIGSASQYLVGKSQGYPEGKKSRSRGFCENPGDRNSEIKENPETKKISNPGDLPRMPEPCQKSRKISSRSQLWPDTAKISLICTP